MGCRKTQAGWCAAVVLGTLLVGALAGSTIYASGPAPLEEQFTNPQLAAVWYLVNDSPGGWSLTERPGFLRIRTDVGGFQYTPPPPRNVVLMRVSPADDFTIETRLEFQPTQNFQYAGLIFYIDPDSFLAIGRAYCGYPACVGDGIYVDHEEYGVTFPQPPFIPWEGTAVFLRAEKVGNEYRLLASHDGQAWINVAVKRGVGAQFQAVGLFAVNGPYELPIPAVADFDYFTLSPAE